MTEKLVLDPGAGGSLCCCRRCYCRRRRCCWAWLGDFVAGLAACKEHRLQPAEEKEIRARVAAGEGPRRRRAAICAARCLASCPRLLPATEAEEEALERHEANLEWRKASPSTACRAGDSPARFALRSLC
jgi:hypothetical protein